MPAVTIYPLQALLKLRTRIAEHRQRELGQAVGELRRAEEALERAGLDLEEHRRRVAGARESLVAPGEPTVAEVHRAESYLSRLLADQEEANGRYDQAARQEASRRSELAEAQRRLLAAEADRQAVERSYQSWDRTRQEEALRRAEQELDDLALGRHGQASAEHHANGRGASCRAARGR